MAPHRTQFTGAVEASDRFAEWIKNLTEFIAARTALSIQDCRIEFCSVVRTIPDRTRDDRSFTAFKSNLAFLLKRTTEVFISTGVNLAVPSADGFDQVFGRNIDLLSQFFDGRSRNDHALFNFS